MKRRDLERHLRQHGARLLREGGGDSYRSVDAERSSPLLRHRQIHWRLAREICKQLGIAPPEGGKYGERSGARKPGHRALHGSGACR